MDFGYSATANCKAAYCLLEFVSRLFKVSRLRLSADKGMLEMTGGAFVRLVQFVKLVSKRPKNIDNRK